MLAVWVLAPVRFMGQGEQQKKRDRGEKVRYQNLITPSTWRWNISSHICFVMYP